MSKQVRGSRTPLYRNLPGPLQTWHGCNSNQQPWLVVLHLHINALSMQTRAVPKKKSRKKMGKLMGAQCRHGPPMSQLITPSFFARHIQQAANPAWSRFLFRGRLRKTPSRLPVAQIMLQVCSRPRRCQHNDSQNVYRKSGCEKCLSAHEL